jgi:hypothetical protein
VVAVLRLGVSERGITEILGVAEHVVSITAAAEGLRLRPDVPARASGSPTELIDLEAAVPEECETSLTEIRTWSREALGVDHVPAFWRALARKPRLLLTVWEKHRLVLGADELPADLKAAVALAAAMNKHSDYWTGYFAQLGRSAHGFDDEIVVEIAGAVLHYTSFNTISHGMMLEAPHVDVVAKDFPADPATRTEKR